MTSSHFPGKQNFPPLFSEAKGPRGLVPMQHVFPKTPLKTTGGSNYCLPSHSHNTQQHPQPHLEAFVRMTSDSYYSVLPPQATFGGLMLAGSSLPRRCPTHQHRNALGRNRLAAFFFFLQHSKVLLSLKSHPATLKFP